MGSDGRKRCCRISALTCGNAESPHEGKWAKHFAKVRVASSNLVARSREKALVTGPFLIPSQTAESSSEEGSVHIPSIRRAFFHWASLNNSSRHRGAARPASGVGARAAGPRPSGQLDSNPARGLRPRHLKSERYEYRIWTYEQLTDFLRAAKRDRLFARWRLVAFTGMRRVRSLH